MHHARNQKMNFREEKDSMGTVRVPESAYYGPADAAGIG